MIPPRGQRRGQTRLTVRARPSILSPEVVHVTPVESFAAQPLPLLTKGDDTILIGERRVARVGERSKGAP